MEARTVKASKVHMTEMVLPSHTNSMGTIFGGQIVSWIDIAAAISAQRHCSMPVVTASIDDMHFIAPVRLGWVVNLEASVNFVARSSMEVGVRVDAENPRTGETFHTATAYLTFVALDDRGRPAAVPPLDPETPDELRRHREAEARRRHRLERRKAAKNHRP
jgi:acyl-CoA hydrolase